MTDNGSESRAHQFGRIVTSLGARQKCRPAADQRLRGAGPGNHPGGVLEAFLCPLPGSQADRIAQGAEPLPSLLQPGLGPHRPLEPRKNPRGGHRQGQNLFLRNSGMCRYISETGQPRRCRSHSWLDRPAFRGMPRINQPAMAASINATIWARLAIPWCERIDSPLRTAASEGWVEARNSRR